MKNKLHREVAIFNDCEHKQFVKYAKQTKKAKSLIMREAVMDEIKSSS